MDRYCGVGLGGVNRQLTRGGKPGSFRHVLHVQSSLTQELSSERHSQAVTVIRDTHADVLVKQSGQVPAADTRA